MRSKADIIRDDLAGRNVLDIGGRGYGQHKAYEEEMAEAWRMCKSRVCLDFRPGADIVVDLNALPLPSCDDLYEIATAFDVLEHLTNPVDVLRWIPSNHLIVAVPNALSWIARWMERRNKLKHLFSFTLYTASVLLQEGGWRVRRVEYQFGRWSMTAKAINLLGSLFPSRIATGIVLHCERAPHKKRM